MNVFHELSSKITLLNPLTIFVEFAKQREVNDNVINAIQKRLYEKGITGDGVTLITDRAADNERYSPLTISLKSRANEPDDRVTLKDTGEFYDSMATVVSKLYIEIGGDFIKDEHMRENFKLTYGSDEEFEESVLSLSENEIINIFINQFIDYYERKVNEVFQV